VSRPALLLVDGINDFYDPRGANYYPDVEATVQPILRLLERGRANGALIVHAVERHRPGLDDFEWRKLPEHSFLDSFESAIFEPFTPSGDLRELELHKRRFSAFFATDLALTLREQDVETIVLAGVKTNVCVRATAQDAFAHGFGVVVPREATNSNRPHLADASLEDIDRYIGRVVALEEAIELL
jgi:nicotinamidase-related amidase